MCGPWPAPVGGVSVHIQRLSQRLEERGLRVAICDESPDRKQDHFFLRSFNLRRYIRLVRQADLLHIHSSVHWFRLLHLFSAVLFGKPAVITFHSWRAGGMTTRLWRLLLRATGSELVFVSEEIAQQLALPGLVAPAYVQGVAASEPPLPQTVVSWIEQQACAGRLLLVSNAYRLNDHAGADLYGLDHCLALIQSLRDQGVAAALLFVVANPEGGEEKLTSAEAFINNHALADHCLIHRGALSYVRLLQRADIALRTTNTDGDALSVRESLAAGCITIASDVTRRPAGVRLFGTRDEADLLRVVTVAIKDLAAGRGECKPVADEDCVAALALLYQRLFRKSGAGLLF